jgi:hypothetical protein
MKTQPSNSVMTSRTENITWKTFNPPKKSEIYKTQNPAPHAPPSSVCKSDKAERWTSRFGTSNCYVIVEWTNIVVPTKIVLFCKRDFNPKHNEMPTIKLTDTRTRLVSPNADLQTYIISTHERSLRLIIPFTNPHGATRYKTVILTYISPATPYLHLHNLFLKWLTVLPWRWKQGLPTRGLYVMSHPIRP